LGAWQAGGALPNSLIYSNRTIYFMLSVCLKALIFIRKFESYIKWISSNNISIINPNLPNNPLAPINNFPITQISTKNIKPLKYKGDLDYVFSDLNIQLYNNSPMNCLMSGSDNTLWEILNPTINGTKF